MVTISNVGPSPASRQVVKQICHFSTLPDDVAGDEVFDLIAAFRADTHPDRVNLGAGVYRTEEGNPWPLPVVEKIEQAQFHSQDPARHEYLPIAGDSKFLELAAELVFGPGDECDRLRVASVQTISGTGANHIGALFLAKTLKPRHVWISDPTWINHHSIWELAGVDRKLYPYYNKSDCTFDFDGMMDTLEEHAQPDDIIVLHACAHNPTGLDPSREQWEAIADLCSRKRLFPFFDNAYQGFASGDLDKDAWAIRYFFQADRGFEMCVAQSFSKSMGLYGQRTGAFHLVSREGNARTNSIMVSHLSHLVRGEFSMAPRYGSSIVRTVLENKQLMQEWLRDLRVMSDRIKISRHKLYDNLIKLNTPGSWTHIINQASSLLCSVM